MASLTSVMKRINLISDLRGRVRKACDCSFIHWHRASWCISVPCWICITVYPVKTPLGSFTRDASPRYWRLPSPPFCHLNQDLFVHCQLMKKVKSRARDGVMTSCQLMSHCIRSLVCSFSRSLARSLVFSLARSLARSLVCFAPSPLRPFAPTPLRPLVPSYYRPFLPSSLRPIVPSSLRLFVPSSIHLLNPSSLRPIVSSYRRPFVFSSLLPFVHSFLHSSIFSSVRFVDYNVVQFVTSSVFFAVILNWICWTLDHPL